MKYNLSHEQDSSRFVRRVQFLKEKGSTVELKEVKDTRTTRQNSALHLYLDWLSEEFNGLGITYNHPILDVELPYTMEIVKEQIWKPIQLSLFGTNTTTKLNTEQMNEVIDVISKFLGERGVYLEFPNIDTLINSF